jgi:hypothetical protein
MKRTIFAETNQAMFTFLTQRLITKRDFYYGALVPSSITAYNYSTKLGRKPYNGEMRKIYNNFVIALLHNKFNLQRDKFTNYAEIIKFLEQFQGDRLFSGAYISKLKSHGMLEKVPLNDKSVEFINYVKKEFPDFDDTSFVFSKSVRKLPLKSYSPAPSDTKEEVKSPSRFGFSNMLPLQSSLLHFYRTRVAYLFFTLPYFILLFMAIKDNPSDVYTYINEFEVELAKYKDPGVRPDSSRDLYTGDYFEFLTNASANTHPEAALMDPFKCSEDVKVPTESPTYNKKSS